MDVAADVLDSSNMLPWVAKFKRYARNPRIWGLHNYQDSNHFRPLHATGTKLLLRGRDYVLTEDLRALAKDALRHRIILTYQALAESVEADQILDNILRAVPIPHIDLADQELSA